MDKGRKKWKNNITGMLNLQYPIIQAPMLGVATPQMVAAAAEAGALGSLPLGDLPADKCAELIRFTRQLTDKPFAVNIFLHDLPVQNDALKKQYDRTKIFLRELSAQYQLEVDFPEYEDIKPTDYHQQVDALIAENCKIVSFTFGILDAASIAKFKQNGTLLIGTATSVAEAVFLEKSDIDIVCVQGYEAGGHRGSFMEGKFPEIGGFSLLPQVFDTVKVPLVYAGGIYDAKTVLAAQMLGAQGFQIGSLLLGSAESALQEFEKGKLRNTTETDMVLTKSFSGRYARGIRNIFVDAVEQSGYILPYPYQNRITAPLRHAAKLQQNPEFLSLWKGQSHTGYSSKSTKDIILDLVKKVENYEPKSY